MPQWAARIGMFALLGPFTAFGDLPLLRRLRRGSRLLRPLLTWTLPVVLSLFFVWLFSLANPIIEDWIWKGLDRVGEFFSTIFREGRALIWAAAWLLAWGFLRFRPRAIRLSAPPPARELPPLLGREVVTRCLLLFNAVFAVQTVLDIRYLWYGAALPPGLTYAGYAHRGAYPLLAATLAAAAAALCAYAGSGTRVVEYAARPSKRAGLSSIATAVVRFPTFASARAETALRSPRGHDGFRRPLSL